MALARELGAPIVSVDSMQVYRGMDIGTAKPSLDQRRSVVHHMIDIADPEDPYTVAEFQRTGVEVLDRARAAGPVVIAGGSGLHFRALVDPLQFPPTDAATRAELEEAGLAELRAELLAADPEAGLHVDLDNPRRLVRAVEVLRLTGATPSMRAATPDAARVRSHTPRVAFTALGLDPGERLAGLVVRRFDAMLDAGLVAEVAGLAPRLGPTAREAVGYRELMDHVRGETTLERARAVAIRATTSLAGRQRTFFRRDPRILWLPWQDDTAARIAAAIAALEGAGWTS